MHAVLADEALDLVGAAEIGRVDDLVGERVVVDEADHADPVLRTRGELLGHAARDPTGADDERGLGGHDPAAHDHEGECPQRRRQHHERDEEERELADRRGVDAEHGVGELTGPRGRGGKEHEAGHVVGRAVAHAQLVLRIVAVEPRERDPGEKPRADQRWVGESVGAAVDRANGERRDQEGDRIREHETAAQEPTTAPRIIVAQMRRGVAVWAHLVVRDALGGDQGVRIRTCVKPRRRHVSPTSPVSMPLPSLKSPHAVAREARRACIRPDEHCRRAYTLTMGGLTHRPRLDRTGSEPSPRH